MFPLHIWLPDAMEGPTPVSALIHAATMVVAGVFLVARLFPVFAISAPDVLQLMDDVGALSALFAAVIACTQTDIKRVLAYSTMSQIGYMMFALGVSGYGGEDGLGFTASMFHLFTHALFKALLFLGAGAVIHYVHSNEMKDMGGLRKDLPITHITFLIACLAIAGIPPFAGFFSKEEILLAAYNSNRPIYWIALITSGLTAFYMFRLYFTIFWKKPEHVHSAQHGEHKAEDLSMMLPLVVLGIGCSIGRFYSLWKLCKLRWQSHCYSAFTLQFSIAPVVTGTGRHIDCHVVVSRTKYKPAKDVPAALECDLYNAAYHKFYIDEIYLFITKKILFNLVGRPAAWFDRNVVDGLVNWNGNCNTDGYLKILKDCNRAKCSNMACAFLVGIIIIISVYLPG